MVVSNVSPFLKTLAYVGFFYHLILALSVHVAAGDGPEMTVAAASGLVFLGGLPLRPQGDLAGSLTSRRRPPHGGPCSEADARA